MTRPRSRVTLCNTVTLLPPLWPGATPPVFDFKLRRPLLSQTKSAPPGAHHAADCSDTRARHDRDGDCFILNCHLQPQIWARHRVSRPGARNSRNSRIRRVIYADLE